MTATCPDCAAAGLRMKPQGFRDWRTAYACYEHAAVDLDGPWWSELMAANARAGAPEINEQLEMFGGMNV